LPLLVSPPFPYTTLFRSDTFTSGGDSRAASLSAKPSGTLILGTFIFNVRGSVITPAKAEAAAVSGLHKYTLSSIVPDRPGKLRGDRKSTRLNSSHVSISY